MKKGDYKTITILDDNGVKSVINSQYLGKGAFATCYKYNGFVYSFIKEIDSREFDYSKEGIALWADEENPHIPDYKYLGDVNGCKLYRSTFYNDLIKKYAQAWQDYKAISESYNKFTSAEHINFFKNREFIESLSGKVSESIISALHNINDNLANYGDYYYMEFPKRNLKVDDKGNLILLDVFFNPKALRWYKS